VIAFFTFLLARAFRSLLLPLRAVALNVLSFGSEWSFCRSGTGGCQPFLRDFCASRRRIHALSRHYRHWNWRLSNGNISAR